MRNEQLLKEVKNYWNKASCGTTVTQQPKHSHAYFDEIECHRYNVEPHIFAFAQFTRFHGKKVLEVGVGAGTDFLQWVRAGAQAYGVDLTPEAIANTKARLALYGLQAVELQVADAERLPYPDNFFDVTYSWGVIHHSPDTPQCLSELIRVTKPGGLIKYMVYNRYSLYAWYLYLRRGLMRGRPFQSLSVIMYNHQESLGTKAYSCKEMKKLIENHKVELCKLDTSVGDNDFIFHKPLIRPILYFLASLGRWWKLGLHMRVELRKK